MLGSWEVNVTLGEALPEKVATGFSKLEDMVGAEYTPIAYLGSQVVNGINHAVLAEQLLITGKDTKNIVLVILNEKPGEMSADVVSIERVLTGGEDFGGVKIDVETGDGINKTAQRLFEERFAGFVGTLVTPIALLGTQVVRGMDYYFLAERSPVIDNDPKKDVVVVRICDLDDEVAFTDILGGKADRMLK